ncbi:MAG: hypothetical protein HKN73_09955 [Gemmatimonadetes bacterium]|nr:hypothetical protein [Gemmatimonadota bacterium]
MTIVALDVRVNLVIERERPRFDRPRAEIQRLGDGEHRDLAGRLVALVTRRVGRSVVVATRAPFGIREGQRSVGPVGVVTSRAVQILVGVMAEGRIDRGCESAGRPLGQVGSRCPLATEPWNGPGGQQEASGQENHDGAS